MRVSSYRSFKQDFISNLYALYTLFFLLVEVKAQHIPCAQMPVVQVLEDLLLS